MNHHKRLFIAIEAPLINDRNQPIDYAPLQEQIKKEIPHFKPSTSLHVTLVYIGDTHEQLVPAIAQIVKEGVDGFVKKE